MHSNGKIKRYPKVKDLMIDEFFSFGTKEKR